MSRSRNQTFAADYQRQLPVKTGRRWLPWRSRSREWVSRAGDLVPSWMTPTGDDPISSTIAVIFAIICFPLLIPLLLTLPVFLVESLLQLLLTTFAVLLRMIGALAVEVDVRQAGHVMHREMVSGWGAAKGRMRQIEQLAAAGARPPYDPRQAPGVPPPPAVRPPA